MYGKYIIMICANLIVPLVFMSLINYDKAFEKAQFKDLLIELKRFN